jgi:hypothetical protein
VKRTTLPYYRPPSRARHRLEGFRSESVNELFVAETAMEATAPSPPLDAAAVSFGETAMLEAVTPDGMFVQVGTARFRHDDASIRKLKTAQSGSATVGSSADGSEYAALQPALAAVAKYGSSLRALPGVLAVRVGYKFRGGQITPLPCVVVVVDRKRADLPASQRVPASLDGIATDVTMADPYERLATVGGPEAALAKLRLLIDEIQPGASEAEFLEALPVTTYEPPKGLNLDPVSGAMTITCHVSPDAGWRVLKPFLTATRRSLCLGMYDFTAPHIYQTARSVLRDSDVGWKQTLSPNQALPTDDDVDSPKAGDLTEKQVVTGLKRLARDRFENAFAQVGSGQTFASAYHIKVVVRDEAVFWLSSGNWQSSNQPDIDFLDADADRQQIPRYNREWHVVVENAALAKLFQRYLEYDFEVASASVAREEAAPALPELLIPFEETTVEERAGVDLECFRTKRSASPRTTLSPFSPS